MQLSETTETTNNTDKPDAYVCMVFSLIDYKDNMHTFITPLFDFKTELTDKYARITIYDMDTSKLKDFPKEVKEFYMLVTDDATVSWAGDWRDLGCFSLEHSMVFNPEIVSFEPFTIRCEQELVKNKPKPRMNYKRDLYLPDRVYGKEELKNV